MKVIFDLVYYHCGPSAVLMKNNPDYVYRNSDGSITYGEWRFPRLNFENQMKLQTVTVTAFITTVFAVETALLLIGVSRKRMSEKEDLS